MRVLLDESLPRQLAHLLTGHFVTTVPRVGWAGMTNGELLRRAAAEFDVFVTGDQNLQFQQNLSDLDLAVVVLAARDNRIETISALAPRLLEALSLLEPGRIAVVEA